MKNTIIKGEKSIKKVKTLFLALFFAGLIILIIGMYYSIIKAGIPYQDPPLELQIQYAINMGIGDELVRDGLIIAAAGLIPWMILRRKQAKTAQEES